MAFDKSEFFRCQSTFATLVCQRNCVFLCKGTKLQNSAKPNSGDSLPVFALECFSANETGGLGLWLGAFGPLGGQGFIGAKASLDPRTPCFCGTELRFGSLCNLGLSKKLRFSLQRHKTPEFGEAEFWR